MYHNKEAGYRLWHREAVARRLGTKSGYQEAAGRKTGPTALGKKRPHHMAWSTWRYSKRHLTSQPSTAAPPDPSAGRPRHDTTSHNITQQREYTNNNKIKLLTYVHRIYVYFRIAKLMQMVKIKTRPLICDSEVL